MRGKTIAVMAGLEAKLFWFLFFKQIQSSKSLELPKFTKQDEIALATANEHVMVTETVSFGEIYANKTKSTITPLPHHVFKRWHWGRIMLLGDSVHKVGRYMAPQYLFSPNEP